MDDIFDAVAQTTFIESPFLNTRIPETPYPFKKKVRAQVLSSECLWMMDQSIDHLLEKVRKLEGSEDDYLDLLESAYKRDSEILFGEIQRRCQTYPADVSLLGTYSAAGGEIDYYEPEKYRDIVRVHERMHAIHHLLPDAQGEIWTKFDKIDPYYKEFLAQLFTYKYFEERDAYWIRPMLELCAGQSFIYNSFKIYRELSKEACLDQYWGIRCLGKVPRIAKELGKRFLPPEHWPPSLPKQKSGDPGGNVVDVYGNHWPQPSPMHKALSVKPFYESERAGERRPAFLFTVHAAPPTDATISPHVSGKIRVGSGRFDIVQGDRGFLLRKREHILGVIQCTCDLSPHPQSGGQEFEYSMVERWDACVPLKEIRKYLIIKKITNPVQPILEESDFRVIRAVGDAYQTIHSRMQNLVFEKLKP